MEEDKILSVAELKLLIKMSLINSKELLTISGLAELIGSRSSSPIFVSVINYLKEKEMIKIRSHLGNTKVVSIDYIKITDIIDEHELTNFFFKYFREWHVVTW